MNLTAAAATAAATEATRASSLLAPVKASNGPLEPEVEYQQVAASVAPREPAPVKERAPDHEDSEADQTNTTPTRSISARDPRSPSDTDIRDDHPPVEPGEERTTTNAPRHHNDRTGALRPASQPLQTPIIPSLPRISGDALGTASAPTSLTADAESATPAVTAAGPSVTVQPTAGPLATDLPASPPPAIAQPATATPATVATAPPTHTPLPTSSPAPTPTPLPTPTPPTDRTAATSAAPSTASPSAPATPAAPATAAAATTAAPTTVPPPASTPATSPAAASPSAASATAPPSSPPVTAPSAASAPAGRSATRGASTGPAAAAAPAADSDADSTKADHASAKEAPAPAALASAAQPATTTAATHGGADTTVVSLGSADPTSAADLSSASVAPQAPAPAQPTELPAAWAVPTTAHAMTVQLAPHGLGNVTAHIDARGSQVTVSVTADNEAGRELLRDSLPSLAEHLRTGDGQQVNVSLGSATSGDASASSRQDAADQRSTGSGSHNGHPATTGSSAEHSAATAPVERRTPTDRLLDVSL